MSDEILREFLVESNEPLDTPDREFVNLEKGPANSGDALERLSNHPSHQGHLWVLGFGKLESVASQLSKISGELRDRNTRTW